MAEDNTAKPAKQAVQDMMDTSVVLNDPDSWMFIDHPNRYFHIMEKQSYTVRLKTQFRSSRANELPRAMIMSS